MKRDFDLVRRILLDIEAMPPGDTAQGFEYQEYDHATIAEHVRLLIEAGLVDGEIGKTFGGIHFHVSGLTWSGHDFLRVAKDDTIWMKAKQTILKPASAITFDLLWAWLKEQAKQQLGLP